MWKAPGARWLGSVALAVAPAAALLFAARRAGAEPDASPRRFVTEQQRRPGHTVVACVGASLVHGRVGASFVDVLAARLSSARFQFVNAGRNGDLAYNAKTRLDGVIACEPDIVVVLVGTNDVLASLDAHHGRAYRLAKKLPTTPTLGFYRENLTAIVDTLTRRTRARVVLCTLPPLDEGRDAGLVERVGQYNAVVREVAARTGAAFIPVHESVEAWLAQTPAGAAASFRVAVPRMLYATVAHYVLGRSWDAIAASHGYALFIDGIHAGERCASLLADPIERFLRTDPFVPRAS